MLYRLNIKNPRVGDTYYLNLSMTMDNIVISQQTIQLPSNPLHLKFIRHILLFNKNIWKNDKIEMVIEPYVPEN